MAPERRDVNGCLCKPGGDGIHAAAHLNQTHHTLQLWKQKVERDTNREKRVREAVNSCFALREDIWAGVDMCPTAADVCYCCPSCVLMSEL